MIPGTTSIVLNAPYYMPKDPNGLPPYYYRCRNCDTNLTSNSTGDQYQRQKLIQKTVRVPASLYTMNVGSLESYKKPLPQYQNVCWNQMSDRPQPSVQNVVTSSGSTYGGNSTKRTIVRNRPGAMSPGGSGCDIKHNSYDRYLNRLKGKTPLRRGVIPLDYGRNKTFNPAAPVYGGKTIKTGIVSGCDCPNRGFTWLPGTNNEGHYDQVYTYAVGQTVYAQSVINKSPFIQATIIGINGQILTLQFSDGTFGQRGTADVLPYFECNTCVNSQANNIVNFAIEGLEGFPEGIQTYQLNNYQRAVMLTNPNYATSLFTVEYLRLFQ